MPIMLCEGLFRNSLVVYADHLAKVITGSNKGNFNADHGFFLIDVSRISNKG